ncbi:hypothetical protein HA402_007760 [Bradysia odoriphaga]|nr:hypothetical protein HA402_007760 [Bradysia odoriphaga]
MMFKMMLKIITFVALFTTAIASTDSDISTLFDTFLKDVVDSGQLADGSYQSTYFNIPHREAPGLIEPFLFGTRADSAQLTLLNVKRLRPVNKEIRRQYVSDGEDFEYSVLATAVTMDIQVRNLAGNLTNFVGNNERGEYWLNGNLQNFVMNVTMETEYGVTPVRDIVPTIVDMIVSGSDEERTTVESLSAQIVGDLVANSFFKVFRDFANGKAGKALADAVVDILGKQQFLF